MNDELPGQPRLRYGSRLQQQRAAGVRTDLIIMDETWRLGGEPGADAASWTAAPTDDDDDLADEPDTGSWAVILLSHLPYHISHAWYIDGGQIEAELFAAFVTQEIDPAIAVRLDDSAAELLRWRTHIAQPAIVRAGRARALAQRLLDGSHYGEGDERDPAVVAQLRVFAEQFIAELDGPQLALISEYCRRGEHERCANPRCACLTGAHPGGHGT
jgi:hypothetical protein